MTDSIEVAKDVICTGRNESMRKNKKVNYEETESFLVDFQDMGIKFIEDK